MLQFTNYLPNIIKVYNPIFCMNILNTHTISYKYLRDTIPDEKTVENIH